MAGETNPTANPTPAATGGIDYEKLGAAIAAANKPLLDRLTALESAVKPSAAPATDDAAQPSAGVTAPKTPTLSDFEKLLDKKLGERDQSAAIKMARDAAAARMSDLPEAYRAQLPQTADAAELARAEQSIRTTYAADFKKAAPGAAPVVNGNPPPNGAPATRPPLDTSKMTGAQLIGEGLKERPVINVTGVVDAVGNAVTGA